MPQAPLTLSVLAPGTLFADRFIIEQQAGSGGMGSVYKAQDRSSGRSVALKLMHASAHPLAVLRFEREAQLLSELRHPGIVSYVAHGLTQEGPPFLAMEWLQGEDLAQRLARAPLSLPEALQFMRRIADALSVAHAQGIVHRDIKPSNLFLRGGRADDAVLLDFGLARLATGTRQITASTVVLGTPGYMSPEQAAGRHDISPRADLFALGCVLYHFLAGQPPFRAPHPAAVLAKILFFEPTPLRTLRPALPLPLLLLVDRLLAKNPAHRLADARELQHALESLPETGPLPRRPSASIPTLTNAEQHLVSVLLASPRTALSEASTLGLEVVKQAQWDQELLRRELETHGARAELLADGSLLATFLLERGTATDLATLAAHCALSVKERLSDRHVVLTTGLSLRDEPVPVGEVMDRAGGLLRGLEQRRIETTAHVVLDDTTAGLLGPRFRLVREPSGTFTLHDEHPSVDETRTLLGRPTPCVGREQELALLELAFTASVEDSAARALLVMASAGTGKSRLRHEFLRRLKQRSQPPRVLLGRGDPMNAGSGFGLMGQVVRHLCGVVDGEPPEARRAKLARRVAQHLPPGQAKDTVEFLGELCGVVFPAGDSPKLHAARGDPRLMSAQVLRAMVAFLRAELSQGPVLLVLEDLHWSDTPTVRLVDDVLRELADTPLLVLALGRPETKDLFPGLWGRFLHEMPLRGLSPRACARLVQEVLGPHVSEAVVSRLVDQSAGNPLFLEELIRGVAEGLGEETPGTVLAMLQHRLQRLEPGLRRVLMAASIYGRTFWQGGVHALVAADLSPSELEHHLGQLVELEVMQRQDTSRFPGEMEFRFRHALLRDAAYSLVPAMLKPGGHSQAGDWLERMGELDPLVLAEHYQLGQQNEQAARFFTRASERLFERQDMQGTLRCLEAASACAPQGELLTELRALEVSVFFWLDEFARAYALGKEVLPQLRVGSTPWCQVIGQMFLSGSQSGQHAELARLGELFASTTPDADAASFYIQAAAFLAGMSTWFGQREAAAAMLGHMETVGTTVRGLDGRAQGWMFLTRGYFAHWLDARPWQVWRLAEEAKQVFSAMGFEHMSHARTILGLGLAGLGDIPGAVAAQREGLASALKVGQAAIISQIHLIMALLDSSDATHQEEAHALARQVLETEKVNPLRLGNAQGALAVLATRQGRFSEAESWARQACETLNRFLPYQLVARTVLCTTLLKQGRAPEARQIAESGVQVLERMGGAGASSVGMWLALAEACLAQGDETAGDSALRRAVQCLLLRAEDIPDATARERFMAQVPLNARTRELASQRWGKHWAHPPS
jgi:serine/threonine protein kinase/tetratricopeptide (TPR) repeat protein